MQKKTYICILGILSLLSFSLSTVLKAQNNSNPFELTHRLPKKTIKKSEATFPENQNPFDLSHRINRPNQPEDISENSVRNPFDIIKKKEAGSTVIDRVPKPVIKEKSEPAQSQNDGFVFWFILIMTVFLALLITIYKSLIVKVYRAFTNDNILKLLHREQGNIVAFPYFLFYLLFFINAGAFIFFSFHFFDFIPLYQSYLYYSILGVAGFFLFKHFLLKIIEAVFPVRKEVKIYSFSIIIFSIILGIMLIPANIIAAFASPVVVVYGIYGGFIIVSGVYLFRFLRSLFIASKFITFHKFHFFMYLCTVEIAPVLILVKILMNSAGIH